MWLLNCANYRLEPNDLDGLSPKPYWILSHTWGDDEVTFQDMQNPTLAAQKKGFQKIKAMCELASANGQMYVWIDTCCIDKSSSAELSESINSMFYWYQKAARCIAYLEDLLPYRGMNIEDELRRCRWFTRGWTLQELLAPREVDFYDSQWNLRGTKGQICAELSNITKIDNDNLKFPSSDSLQRVPVARKMSWAAGRQTTRIEDKAYCLLGIFDVHMPLLYGEREQAFVRLQQTIAQKGNDMSLFAWIARPDDGPMKDLPPYSGLLASDPSQFAACSGVEPIRDPLLPSPSWIITNAGIEMTTALDCSTGLGHTVITRASDNTLRGERCPSVYSFCYRLFLHCQPWYWHDHFGTPDSGSHGFALWLRKTRSGFVRFRPTELCLVQRSAMDFNDPGPIRIAISLTRQQLYDTKSDLRLLSDASFVPHMLRWGF
ncbi:heterokaryon incompatibility protein-domain-containing protein [Parachaetomium inaequale]|uniref:Heterokaryon incompatibility protein-domain-containing protein n=1 Tax=Parachaetomium inaequale TaxID=2588326 RepID=A0AAN6PEK9_9PEZI|nr:heterokaryon incompatibility protein-domain-containing protein [Parachaetomium inaequale]